MNTHIITNTMKKTLLLLATVLLCTGTAFAADKNVTVTLESNAQRISAGDPLTVDIYLENPSNYPLTSATVALSYDTALLEGTSVTYGDAPYFDVDIYPGEEQKFRTDGLVRIGRASLSDGTGRDLSRILLATLEFTPKQSAPTTEFRLAEVVAGEDAYVIKMLENGAYVEVEDGVLTALIVPAMRAAAGGNRPVTPAATESTTSADINAALGATAIPTTTDTSIVPISATIPTQTVTTPTSLATNEPNARELATFEEQQDVVPVVEPVVEEKVATAAPVAQTKLKKAPATPQSGPMEMMFVMISLGLGWFVRLRSSRITL